MDRSSEVVINQSNGKITRRHSRQKSGRNTEVKGERFSLQGKRWRFPRDLVSAEVETRITRLRALWGDHERFCHSQLFVDPAELSGIPEFALEEQAKRFMKRQTSVAEAQYERDKAASSGTWPPFGSNGRSGAVTTGDEAAQWSPLALWIADQIKRGIQPVPLPPLPELLNSVFHKGANLYRDSSRNAQSSFGNEWSRLLDRVAKAEGKKTVPRLPFGTLRDQLSNWLGSDQNRAVIASVALAHGIPHKGDKLLFKHYSNRPWGHLFEAQKEYRELMQPVLEEAADPLVIHDPLTIQIVDLWNAGTQDVQAIAKQCDVHVAKVRRKLRDCDFI